MCYALEGCSKAGTTGSQVKSTVRMYSLRSLCFWLSCVWDWGCHTTDVSVSSLFPVHLFLKLRGFIWRKQKQTVFIKIWYILPFTQSFTNSPRMWYGPIWSVRRSMRKKVELQVLWATSEPAVDINSTAHPTSHPTPRWGLNLGPHTC